MTNTHVPALIASGANLFAGTGGGLFRVSDTGGAWAKLNLGSTLSDVYSLAVSDSHLFAGTYVGSVWKIPVATIPSGLRRSLDGSAESGWMGGLAGLVRSGAALEISVRRRSPVSLVVHDAMGNKVVTLLDRVLEPGIHHASVDGARIPPAG